MQTPIEPALSKIIQVEDKADEETTNVDQVDTSVLETLVGNRGNKPDEPEKSSRHDYDKSFSILSFDGGGSRGIMEAIMLRVCKLVKSSIKY